ncbi:MAG: hypothetical protein OEO79_04230 [Gemmatimonadota bacterium]|nr:hypothetical protein [Gemmatimonadota bacterium]MDH3422335.1 hypothetical protein [Gemmatimonadota bacterium]
MTRVGRAARNGRGRFTDRAKGILALESIAIGISLAAPVTPSRTGSTWSPAEFFTPDPNYLQDVLASFVAVNIILLLLGTVAWLVAKVGRSG